MAFLAIFLLDLRTALSGLVTREYFSDREAWGPGEDGPIRLRRTDCGSTREPLGVEKLSGRIGASTRSRQGEAGEPGESCGPGEVCAIRSLEADRPAPTPRSLGSWGVAIRELTVTDSSLPASDFLGVDSLSDTNTVWEAGALAGAGAGDGVRTDLSWPRCCSALRRSPTLISTMGTSWHWVTLFLGFLVSTVGDSGVGKAAPMLAAAAAAAARVTRRGTEPFSPVAVASCSALSLLRRCREPSWLLRVFLRDNLPKAAEQKLRWPRRGGRHPKIQVEATVFPGTISLGGV